MGIPPIKAPLGMEFEVIEVRSPFAGDGNCKIFVPFVSDDGIIRRGYEGGRNEFFEIGPTDHADSLQAWV